MGLQDCKLSWTPNKSTPESAISIMSSCHNVHSYLTAGFTKVLCISHIFARRCKTSDLPGISYNMLQHGTACHNLRARMSDDVRWWQMMSTHLYPICPHLTAYKSYKLHILRQLTKKVILSSRQTSDMPQGSARIRKMPKCERPWRLFWLVPWPWQHPMEGRCMSQIIPEFIVCHSAFEKRRIVVCNAFQWTQFAQ